MVSDRTKEKTWDNSNENRVDKTNLLTLFIIIWLYVIFRKMTMHFCQNEKNSIWSLQMT